MSNHTPGPYLTADNDPAFVYKLNEAGDANRFWAKVYGHAQQSEIEATARLFKAAPNLLAACKSLIDLVCDTPEMGNPEQLDAVIDARAAIAKAEGR